MPIWPTHTPNSRGIIVRTGSVSGNANYMTTRQRAPRNRTIALEPDETGAFCLRLLRLKSPRAPGDILGRTICQDVIRRCRICPTRLLIC